MRLRNMWVSALGFTLAASIVACGGGSKETAPAESTAPSGKQVDSSTAGDINGVVAFEGVAPKNEPIKMNADPVCMKENPTPQDAGNLRRRGRQARPTSSCTSRTASSGYTFDAPTAVVTFDQKNCRYHPHVFGVQVNQPVEIVNSDPTLHNIHALPKGNAEFNNGQPIQGMKMTHKFTAKEVMVPFKCDVHGWMNAYVGVLDHPYFAVSDKDGKFSLKGLPPGTYTIEAWHEKLGAQTATVTLGAKETKDANFTFKAAAAATD